MIGLVAVLASLGAAARGSAQSVTPCSGCVYPQRLGDRGARPVFNFNYYLATGPQGVGIRLINDAGQVIGFGQTAAGSGNAALFWDPASATFPAPVVLARPGGESYAYSINVGGLVVGTAYDGSDAHGAVWQPSASATPTLLGDVAGSTFTVAYAINDSGRVVGESFGDAVLWDPTGPGAWSAAVVLPDLGGGAKALGVNASGTIVGVSADAAGVLHGMMWEAGGAHAPTVLGGIGLAPDFGELTDFNDRGQILGRVTFDPAIGEANAVLWDPAHPSFPAAISLEPLPAPPGFAGFQTVARAIDASGMIVGHGWQVDRATRAVRWDPAMASRGASPSIPAQELTYPPQGISLAYGITNGLVVGEGALVVDGVNQGTQVPVLWNDRGELVGGLLPNEGTSAGIAIQSNRTGTVVGYGNDPPGGSSQLVGLYWERVPPPRTLSVDPAMVDEGSPAFEAVVTGVGYVWSSTVLVRSVGGGAATARPTRFVDSTELRVQIGADDVRTPGDLALSVLAHAGGVISNEVWITVVTPTPTLTAVSPDTAPEGPSALSLDLTGTGFFARSRALRDGVELATTFVSATRLTATVPGPLAAGTSTLTVQTAGAAAASNGRPLTITALAVRDGGSPDGGTPLRIDAGSGIPPPSSCAAAPGRPSSTLPLVGLALAAWIWARRRNRRAP